LYLISQNHAEVFVVVGKHLDKHGILPGYIMALGDLGNFHQFFRNIIEQGRIIEKNAHKSTGLVSHFFGIDIELGTADDPEPGQPLYPLMHSCPGNAAHPGYF